MRDFDDEVGESWRAIAVDAVVAHGKPGAVLAFVPAGRPESEPIHSTVTFNSHKAADFALRTMSQKELQRRLAMARATI
jgi:hypothetical protein